MSPDPVLQPKKRFQSDVMRIFCDDTEFDVAWLPAPSLGLILTAFSPILGKRNKIGGSFFRGSILNTIDCRSVLLTHFRYYVCIIPLKIDSVYYWVLKFVGFSLLCFTMTIVKCLGAFWVHVFCFCFNRHLRKFRGLFLFLSIR